MDYIKFKWLSIGGWDYFVLISKNLEKRKVERNCIWVLGLLRSNVLSMVGNLLFVYWEGVMW